MARIRKIDFTRTGAQEGCLCDRCGQYIRNIWTVQYTDGITARFGIDCFEQLNQESGLTAFGQKELKNALKKIEDTKDLYEKEKALTEETDTAYQTAQHPWDYESKDYWFGRPWEEYHEWRMTEFWPARFADRQKEVDRFAKVNFKR